MFIWTARAAISLAIAALVLLSHPLAASPDDELRKLVGQGKVDTVDSYFAALHRRHLEGTLPTENYRDAFAVFAGTSIETWNFAKAWVEAKPDSAYANTALGVLLQSHAWRMRGGDFFNYTWPTAIAAFKEHLASSQQFAETAFRLDPTVIGASDLLLGNAVAVGNADAEHVFTIVSTVMKATPNRGTLTRAANIFNPRWGGNIGQLEDLCTRFGSRAAPEVYKSQDICLADLVLVIKPRDELKKRALKVARANDWKGFEKHRLNLYADYQKRHLSNLDPEDVARYLAGEGSNDLQTIQAFYEDLIVNLANPASDRLKDIARKHFVDAQQQALVEITSDPSNSSLVELIFFPPNADQREGPVPDAKDRLEIWSDVLRAAPYDGSIWLDAAEAADEFRKDVAAALALSRRLAPVYGNAIAYSNHKPDVIASILIKMAMKYDGLLTLLPKDNPERRAALRAEADETLACPIARLSRLADVVCSAGSASFQCGQINSWISKIVQETKEHAASNGVCADALTGTLEDQVFFPVDVEIGTYHHKADLSPYN